MAIWIAIPVYFNKLLWLKVEWLCEMHLVVNLLSHFFSSCAGLINIVCCFKESSQNATVFSFWLIVGLDRKEICSCSGGTINRLAFCKWKCLTLQVNGYCRYVDCVWCEHLGHVCINFSLTKRLLRHFLLLIVKYFNAETVLRAWISFFRRSWNLNTVIFFHWRC